MATWFFIDLVAVLPFDLLVKGSLQVAQGEGAEGN